MNEDADGEEHKNIYAHFGLAIYQAQCLEHGLVNALVFLDLIPNRRGLVVSQHEWAELVDSFMDSHFETTLGRMVRALSKVTEVHSQLQASLSTALVKRNWLVHDYFRERVESFLTVAGRRQMLQELEEAHAVLLRADRMLDEIVTPAREKLGLTDAVLSAAVARLREESGA